jgi:hypothetical protein
MRTRVDRKLISASKQVSSYAISSSLIPFIFRHQIIADDQRVQEQNFANEQLQIVQRNMIYALTNFPTLLPCLYLSLADKQSIKFKRILGNGNAALVCGVTVGSFSDKNYAMKIFKDATRFKHEARLISTFDTDL